MRLFLAFPLPVDIVECVEAMQTRLKDKNLRLPESPHLTMKFLGDVDEEKLDVLKATLATIKHPTCEVRLGAIGAFPAASKPRVLWVGVEPVDLLMRLHADAERALKGMFPPDEKFHPHITLARVKSDIDAPTVKRIMAIPVEPREFEVDRLVLFRSVLTGQGPVYTELMEVKLG